MKKQSNHWHNWKHRYYDTPTGNAAPRPLTRHDLATQHLPMWTLRSNGDFLVYRKHIFAPLDIGNAGGKHCSKACVTELRFVTAIVAILNGTARITAWCSFHMRITLQNITPQWNASDHICPSWLKTCFRSNCPGKWSWKGESKRDPSEIKNYPNWGMEGK